MNARNTSPKMHLAAILFSAAAFGASSPALALSPENSAMTPQTLTQEEIRFLMGNSAPQNRPASLAYLSQQEMAETEGKFGLPGAIIGAVGSSAAYAGSVMTSGQQGSWAGFAEAASTGAAFGFFGGPVSGWVGKAILSSQLGFYAGMAGGLVRRGVECFSLQSIDRDGERDC